MHIASVSIDNQQHAKRMQTNTPSKSTKAHMQALRTCLLKAGYANTKVARKLFDWGEEGGRVGGRVERWSLQDSDQHYNRISSVSTVNKLRAGRQRITIRFASCGRNLLPFQVAQTCYGAHQRLLAALP